jgi:hypothetical protein
LKITELFGLASGILVFASVIPYAIRTWQGKIKPNVTSWSLWTVIGLTLLLTYKSSGAEDNVWPAVIGFANPLLIAIIAINRKGEFGNMNGIEKICLIISLASLALWVYLHENRNLVQYALYIAILADLCAAIPTIVFVWKNPLGDRPLAWGLYSLGYGLAVFSISKNTIANFALPLYMFFGALSITAILSIYRIRNHIPPKEWI